MSGRHLNEREMARFAPALHDALAGLLIAVQDPEQGKTLQNKVIEGNKLLFNWSAGDVPVRS